MKILFQGKSNEYEIEKSHFCNQAFIIKDKIANRDEIDFITNIVHTLEFSDDSFSFDEIMEHLKNDNNKDIIIVENCFNDEKDEEKIVLDFNIQEEIQNNITNSKNSDFKKGQFRPLKIFSRIFQNANFILKSESYELSESIQSPKRDKLEIFKNLECKDMEISFAKIEIFNYDNVNDSLNFNLEMFPSGASYKYGISQNTMYVILQGKMSSVSLFNFLKSFVYKNKNEQSCNKIFILTFNHRLIYKLEVSFI
ncbi:DUF5416 family protein [Campylobacter estrildidarum]|uniref:Uncharacterized protein n=1 Tax=Campylobacter estrildidarum TaxID=2510189 RepID=A0A4U7BJT8_9BACT|nr:DUF5416 family protein [Campylobacter estrildidarum]TKX30701.1 hypothetical protein CQA69_05580 [Campylobacter estrildidarum]